MERNAMTTIRILRCLFLVAAVCCAGYAAAQSYPARPIRLVVPYPTGGPTHVVGRLVAAGLQEKLRQTVVVENRPGAASNIGAEYVADAAPDGYTVLFGTNVTFAVNPHLYAGLRFNAARDFAPIAPVAHTPTVLVVNMGLPVRSVAELVAYARAHPGKLKYGSFGNGTIGHLAGVQLAALAGIDILHIPYKGSAQANTDLIGGHIDMVFDTIVTGLPNAKAGKVRVLAVTSAGRSPIAPDLPSLSETVPGYEQSGWYGVVAPKGTPTGILDILHEAVQGVVAQPEVRARLQSLGTTPMLLGRDAFAAFIQEEAARSGQMIHRFGVRPD